MSRPDEVCEATWVDGCFRRHVCGLSLGHEQTYHEDEEAQWDDASPVPKIGDIIFEPMTDEQREEFGSPSAEDLSRYAHDLFRRGAELGWSPSDLTNASAEYGMEDVDFAAVLAVVNELHPPTVKMRGRHASWRGRTLNANGYGMEGAWLVVRIPFTDRWHAFGVHTWWNA